MFLRQPKTCVSQTHMRFIQKLTQCCNDAGSSFVTLAQHQSSIDSWELRVSGIPGYRYQTIRILGNRYTLRRWRYGRPALFQHWASVVDPVPMFKQSLASVPSTYSPRVLVLPGVRWSMWWRRGCCVLIINASSETYKSARSKGGICSLIKWADTAFWFFTPI